MKTTTPAPEGTKPSAERHWLAEAFRSDGCPSWMLFAPNPLPETMPQATPRMKTTFLPAVRLFLALTLLTGLVYPLAVTAVARLCFPQAAGGSLVVREGQVVGSELLAQGFTNLAMFWPRPSSADFAAVPSGASNKGPTSADLKKAIEGRAAALRAAHGLPADAPVPPDLLTASGSGLDPHISPEAARFQIERVAKARGFTVAQRERLGRLVESLIEPPQLGFLGEPRVSVLRLNLALNAVQ
jgi:K+-transporting ATPase ATPase C chain